MKAKKQNALTAAQALALKNAASAKAKPKAAAPAAPKAKPAPAPVAPKAPAAKPAAPAAKLAPPSGGTLPTKPASIDGLKPLTRAIVGFIDKPIMCVIVCERRGENWIVQNADGECWEIASFQFIRVDDAPIDFADMLKKRSK